MNNDDPVLFFSLDSQVDAIFKSFDLTYDKRLFHSMLLDAIGGQLREMAKLDDEIAQLKNLNFVAAVMAGEISFLVRTHLARTVKMSVNLLLLVVRKLAQASFYGKLGMADANRAILPSKDEVTKETINDLLAQWLDDFEVPMRSSGRRPKMVSRKQLEYEGARWLRSARAKYAEMKLMNRKVYRGELGIALGYGKGKEGEQSKESAAKTLRGKLKDYGYKWDDITSPPQGKKKKLRKKSNQKSD